MGVQTSANMMKLISTLALVAAASAQYASAPVAVVKEVPQPYAYEYGVADDYNKANFRKTETQDAAGNVGGSFTIALPDGRIQTTTYTADSLHKDNTVMMRFPRFVSNDDRKRLTMLVHKTTLNYLAIYYSLVIFLFP